MLDVCAQAKPGAPAAEHERDDDVIMITGRKRQYTAAVAMPSANGSASKEHKVSVLARLSRPRCGLSSVTGAPYMRAQWIMMI